MTGGRLEFDFRFSTGRPPARRPSDDQPMRILVLADLTGDNAEARSRPLAERRVLSIDVDNAAQVMARLAPRLSLTLERAGGTSETIELAFGDIEDFHPDRLFHRGTAFASLRKLRAELANPATFARAAALGLAAPTTVAAGPAEAHAATEADAVTIERLLGRAPDTPSPAPGIVDTLVREAVAPHVVPDTAAAQAIALEGFDAMIAQRLRQVLHHPAFQRLEASWRGVWKLANELVTGEQLQIGLLDIRRDEVEADLRDHAEDLSRSALYRALRGASEEAPDTPPWSLVVWDETLGPGEGDMTSLIGLGLLSMRAGAPLLTAVSPAVLGCASTEAVRQMPWPDRDGEARSRWQALREAECAAYIGLALPRLLLRLPYGTRTDPIDSFKLEELPPEATHEDHLWGNPAFGLAFLAGRAFSEQGWAMDLDDYLELEDLPSHILRDEHGETRQQPCAEVLLSEPVANAILQAGIMPLMSYKNRNAVRLLRWQSVALPPRPLAGRWGDGGGAR